MEFEFADQSLTDAVEAIEQAFFHLSAVQSRDDDERRLLADAQVLLNKARTYVLDVGKLRA